MKPFRFLIRLSLLSILGPGQALMAQQPPTSTPTLTINSTLVFLDVTVVDKKGRPVTTGLTRDDFTITEDKEPQKIFSFEAPQEHVLSRNMSNPEGEAPLNILVLDLLDSSFSDMAYIRDETRKYLMAQPVQLNSPAEMMIVGNNSLEMIQGVTRRRDDLVYALDHLPPALPYKFMNGAFFWERFAQAMDALQQIALQNRGMPGRKNIVWVGHGGPNVYLLSNYLTGDEIVMLKEYVHQTVNMMVDSRVSLFVIYPGLKVNMPTFSYSAMQADADIGDDDPFAGDINFGTMVDETGGKLFFNRNDVDHEIARSESMGAHYYTLTYRPWNFEQDGKFRRIRVTLRDPNLRAVTKAGYYSPEKGEKNHPRHEAMVKLAEASIATIPFSALEFSVTNLVQHKDTQTAEFTVNLKAKNLNWTPIDDGKVVAQVTLAANSLDQFRNILASGVRTVTLQAKENELTKLPDAASSFQITVRLPSKTRSVRVVMENADGGRIGSAEIDRNAIDSSPVMPTAKPTPTPRVSAKS